MKYLSIPEELKEVQGCVYRIWYDKHFIVVMGKTFSRSLTSIINDLNRFKKRVRDGKSENNLYINFYHYIITFPGMDFEIEVILKSANQYQLLKHCQIELAEGENDDFCMNSKFEPYINKNIQHNKVPKEKRGQISRGTVLNFLKWRKQTYGLRF